MSRKSCCSWRGGLCLVPKMLEFASWLSTMLLKIADAGK